MAKEEAVLLQRFVASGDAGAFSEIVRRYASLVYSACIRILGDSETAADATQETFFYFLKKANTITGSVPAWLHRVATSKAVDRIRAESARKRAEGQYADDRCRRAANWEDVSPYVDQALDALDDTSRVLLIEYFFKGRSVTDIAAEREISRPTGSRRLKAAIVRLHGQLRKRGIVVAAATIVTLLSENAAQAAPAAVLRELAKMALAGAKLSAPTGGSAAGICETTAAIGGLFLAAKVKIIVVALVVGIGAVGVLTHRHFTRPVGNSDATVVVEKAPASSNAPVVSHPPVVEPDRSPPPAEPIRRNEASAAPESQSPEPAQDQQLIQEPPRETATEEDQTPALDLSSPEATVSTFIKRFVAGDAESVLACFLPGGVDYQGTQKILYADPSDPEQQALYQMKLWFQSLDADAEMPITSLKETPRGIEVVWLVTFKREFTIHGQTFAAGEQMELDGTLVESDGKWLIDGI